MSLCRYPFTIVFCVLVAGFRLLYAQTDGSMSGELTVQLIQGLDSSANPDGMSQGTVTKSSNSFIPTGSLAFVKLRRNPATGIYTPNLVFLRINGRTIAAGSSNVALSSSNTQASVAGPHVYLPANTLIKLTLTDASKSPSRPQAAQTMPVQTPPGVSSGTTDATWQPSADPNGHAVSMDGTGTSSIGHDKVQLVVNCSTSNYLFSTVLIPDALMTSTGNDYANSLTYGTIPKLGRFQVATGPELKFQIEANAGDDSPHKLTIDIPNSFYRAELAGKTLKITLLPPLKNQDEHVVLDFVIPSDPSPMLSVAKPCLKPPTSAKRK